MSLLPSKLPWKFTAVPGSAPVTSSLNTGGYDVLVGGIGFRLATDQSNPFKRTTEQTTIRRVDQSYEPGEQTLSQLPWIKSQSSFHGGAGQQNLEAPFTSFQYEQEQISHIRFDTSVGIDCWTPGKVSRLPDTTFSAFGFAATTMCTATVGGIDYAIIGGNQSLYQVVWAAGPDAAPTVNQIDLSSSTYGGITNCSVSSLTTDGSNYYALIQLTTAGYVPGMLTYVAKGSVTSSAAPVALYEAPNFGTGVSRTNLCVDPDFEGASINPAWTATGTPAPTLSQSTTYARSGTKSLKVTSNGTNAAYGTIYTLPTTVGNTYTFTAYIYNPSVGGTSSGNVLETSAGTSAVFTTTRDSWSRMTVTVKAVATSTTFTIYSSNPTAIGDAFWVDNVLIEQASSAGSFFSGNTASTSTDTYAWTGTANASTSSDTPIPIPGGSKGVIGWNKERLMAGLSNKVYELDTSTSIAAHSALPAARYTHPNPTWVCTAISESPDSVLIAGAVGNQASVMKMTLDTSGATPILAGATSAAQIPLGEIVYSMSNYLGAFIALGTNKGVRIASFDTYSGNMVSGPLSLVTTAPVYGLAGGGRFIYAGYTNQQADGKTGLARLDLSTQIDSAGRLAWAPDLRPPSTAPTGLGTVTAVSVLPYSGRLIFLTPEGIHVQQGVPGHDPNANYWLRTSRIRYDTSEPKLFKLGSVRGSLDMGSIEIVGTTPFSSDVVLGTSGPLVGNNPPDFRLPQGTSEWLQLRFIIQGQNTVLNSYQVKAIPAPSRQHLIQFSTQLYSRETDFTGMARTDQLQPRDRYYAVKALEAAGQEVTLTEFTPTGAINTQVVIDQLEFTSIARRSNKNDFGGTLTFHLRETES